MIKRRAKASWKGSGRDGKGELRTPNATLAAVPFSFQTRFQNEDGKAGTNPEELLAAAHAGCYSMSLGFALEQAGIAADRIDVEAIVTMVEIESGFEIREIHLELEATVPGISSEEFEEMAEAAKTLCPLSMALHTVSITVRAKLTDPTAVVL